MGLFGSGHVQDFNRRLKQNRDALRSKREKKRDNDYSLKPRELHFHTDPLSEKETKKFKIA